MIARDARWSDLHRLLALIEQRRRQLETFNPHFWRPSPRAAARTRLFYRWLLLSGRGTILLAEDGERIVACLIARRVKPPPVYAPGGPTILVDDYCVAAPDLWSSAGTLLLETLITRGRQRGWAQMIVAAPACDQVELDLLRRGGFVHSSSWWTCSL